MYEKIKTGLSNNSFFIKLAVCAALLFCGYMLGHRISPASDNISSTIQSIKGNNITAGKLVDDARGQIKSAGTDIAGAVKNVERAEGLAQQNAGTITECRNIVGALRDTTRKAKSILDDIERANKAPTGS